MGYLPYAEADAWGDAGEATYWEGEQRRNEYADWVEQQALALAEEAETDVEQEE